MKKKVMTLAMMCCLAMSSEAQIYAGDTWAPLPTKDLYDTGAMNSYMRAYSETAAMRREIVDFYGHNAIEAYKNQRWNDVIRDASVALKYAPYGVFYYIRGCAYEALGYYRQAKSDYKASKKDGYSDADEALTCLKAKMRAKRKR